MATATNISDTEKPLPEQTELLIAGTALDTPEYRAKLAAMTGADQWRAAKRDLAFIKKNPPKPPKKPVGRPRKDTTGIMVRVEPCQLASIDAWSASQPDKPTRPEAVRRLVDKALRG